MDKYFQSLGEVIFLYNIYFYIVTIITIVTNIVNIV
jgi:hypothetical protein